MAFIVLHCSLVSCYSVPYESLTGVPELSTSIPVLVCLVVEITIAVCFAVGLLFAVCYKTHCAHNILAWFGSYCYQFVIKALLCLTWFYLCLLTKPLT